jgi:1-acyl-sn-glycerol-3-phosphate acyltransferase
VSDAPVAAAPAAPDEPRITDPLRGIGPRNEAIVAFLRGILKVVSRILFRLSLADVTPIPPGPIILAPNHRSFLDPLVVGSVVSRRPFFLMHARYYHNPLVHWFCRATRCIPVAGEGDNRQALRDGQRVLESGRLLCIFPEGTISPDGELGEAQPGVAWLARKTNAPVIPVWIGGTREALKKGTARLRFSRVTMRIGEPLHLSDFGTGRKGAADFTAALMAAIAELGTRD